MRFVRKILSVIMSTENSWFFFYFLQYLWWSLKKDLDCYNCWQHSDNPFSILKSSNHQNSYLIARYVWAEICSSTSPTDKAAGLFRWHLVNCWPQAAAFELPGYQALKPCTSFFMNESFQLIACLPLLLLRIGRILFYRLQHYIRTMPY